ncbi:hypothetical protein ACOSP7_007185 [Xanthoceras sorbifolium]
MGPIPHFLGFDVVRSAAGVHLSQSKYVVDLLLKTNMSTSKPCPTLICASSKLQKSGTSFSEPFLYRSTIGALQYLTYTRPDISFTVNKLSQYMATPTEDHWKACKRILRYLKGTISLGLMFTPAPSMHIEVYSDADWASCVDD